MAYEDIAGLNNLQSAQSQFAGQQGAQLADPFASQRGQYQNQLSTLLSNPGSIESSPLFQFSYQKGLDALNNHLAGTGQFNSGNALRAASDYNAGAITNQFFPQANLLATLSGATTGSPAAAGMSYVGGINRSQDQRSMAQAAKNFGAQPSAMDSGTPWWATPDWGNQVRSSLTGPEGGSNTGLPSGGAYADPYAQLNAYNQQTSQNTQNILGGAYDNYLNSAYNINSPQAPAPQNYDWANYAGGLEN